jgi:hypothetical protein
MRSIAHVSEQITQASPRRPIASGRNPCGSRAPISRSFVIMTSEYAPRTCDRASMIAESALPSRERANKWTTTSVSVVAWKIAPVLMSASRSSLALTRLPLWPTASCPWTLSITIGWALAMRLSPAVE